MSRRYLDSAKNWRDAPDSTVRAALAAMGADSPEPPPAPVLTVRLDRSDVVLPAGLLTLEDGATLRVTGKIPRGIPPGYHRLDPEAGGDQLTVIASPGRCPLPPERAWGFSAQLYAARSRRSWGIGDLGDLRDLADWSRTLGAGFVVVNPLHATAPTLPQQPSPYFPGSRCFLNPLYLPLDELPGAGRYPELREAGLQARALNKERLINRDRVWELKSAALELLFGGFAGDRGFDAYQKERGSILLSFATYCALAERHGANWRGWPSEYRQPESASVREFVGSPLGRDRVRYHMWLQWLLDGWLRGASEELPVVQDLAVGVDPGGHDAWLWQSEFADGMRVGAPPDRFNTLGQNWALPPFDPWRLRASGYDPWVQSLRGALRHARGLRVDHVMGLFRLYWIPEGAPASDGVYVRYPSEDLLNVTALEAHRAGAFVVGEDLGTVEAGVRRELGQRNVLSYKVWWFERKGPQEWPAKALASVTTHDLPTVAGVITGSDLGVQRRLGLSPNEEGAEKLRDRLIALAGGSDPEQAVRAVYADVARSDCLLLCASLDDAAAVEDRPNMPGTVDEWPNWRLALPVPLEELQASRLPEDIARSLSRRP